MDVSGTSDQGINASQKRRSRMSRKTTGKRIQLTSRDLQILQLLTRYRYLRSTHLHALVGGRSQKRFVERLGDLFHECGYVARPRQQWQAVNARYMPVVYELAPAGRRVLAASGVDQGAAVAPLPKHRQEVARQFHHELMVCDILASIEIGTRADPSLRFISWPEILSSPKMPQATRDASNPMAAPVRIAYSPSPSVKPQSFDRPLVPDAVFGLEYEVAGKSQYRFFALEADRNTEPIVRSSPQRSSLLRKILQYRELVAQSLHRSLWGLPNLFVLTATTNERHRLNIMRSVCDVTDGMGNTFLMFRTMPSLSSLERAPTANGDFLSQPWHRVGYPDIFIDRA